MRPQHRSEVGETLIEVLISLVVIGIVVGAFFAAISTTAGATKAHRDLVSADAVLRDYAETAKQSARDNCNSGNTGAAFTVSYTPPSGFSVSATNLTCPSPTSVNQVDITATLPSGTQKHLSIMVRTP